MLLKVDGKELRYVLISDIHMSAVKNEDCQQIPLKILINHPVNPSTQIKTWFYILQQTSTEKKKNYNPQKKNSNCYTKAEKWILEFC